MAKSEMASPVHVARGIFVDDDDCSALTANDEWTSSVCISIKMHKRAVWIQEKTVGVRSPFTKTPGELNIEPVPPRTTSARPDESRNSCLKFRGGPKVRRRYVAALRFVATILLPDFLIN